ncbi:prepilin-type N-terminal cleavage/methylation domain-containing protein [Luteolibacter sp. LG18]|uniref:prepilin-type N-terminal cleavage/methylation domain-containing protein n=1 Tax=Luteolibacter sp. LG18 TaxID=2819286 RepID=UPI002B2E8253|nr:hypothetical protein llg_06010 [Luteolibacter sp. LG18]
MKTHPSRRKGFTLVELLVVIAIIIVLAAAGFAAAQAAIKKAKQTAAKQGCTSLQEAVNAFYNEYGRLPEPSDSGATADNDPYDTSTGEGLKLVTILLGKETGTNLQNPKQITFLNVPTGKSNKNGLIYSGSEIKGLYDPFGSGYKIVLDYDYNEEIKPPTESGSSTNSDNLLRGKRCIVYSLGVDKKGGAEAVKVF